MADERAPSLQTRQSRRGFLGAAAGGLAAAVGMAAAPGMAGPLRAQGQQPLPGEGATGSLRDPTVVGGSRTPTTARDNDEAIKRIEQQIHCTCGCNLDVFTCRTTDFSCTYSPELHREVVALYDDGKTARQILDAFVAKYGEKVLMAPEPGGFNLLGYLLPGATITVGAVVLAVVIGRRERRRSVALAAGTPSGPTAQNSTPPTGASAEELERVRRALSEVDD